MKKVILFVLMAVSLIACQRGGLYSHTDLKGTKTGDTLYYINEDHISAKVVLKNDPKTEILTVNSTENYYTWDDLEYMKRRLMQDKLDTRVIKVEYFRYKDFLK